VSTNEAPKPVQVQQTTIPDAIAFARRQRASDLHILGGEVIRLRVARRIAAYPYLVPREAINKWVAAVCERDAAAAGKLKRFGAFDVRETDDGGGGLRIHVYNESNGIRLAIRLLGDKPPVFNALGLPPQIEKLSEDTSGLLLIIGPQGVGKSSLAHALVDTMNRRGGRSIIIIEHPMEYKHSAANSTVLVQQEPGHAAHVPTYAQGVINAMNADSNVIVIGQITGYDEAKAAIDAAVKGALVIATIHARNTVQGIESLTSWFNPEEVPRVRQQIAQTFIGGVALRLIPRIDAAAVDAPNVVPAAEVLIPTENIARLIASGKTDDIRRLEMENAVDKGNLTLEASLNELVRQQRIAATSARREAVFKDEIRG
jgi:Tfp pilus assembly pilus retraction ATPase PilT